jgi:hypothetical protein
MPRFGKTPFVVKNSGFRRISWRSAPDCPGRMTGSSVRHITTLVCHAASAIY